MFPELLLLCIRMNVCQLSLGACTCVIARSIRVVDGMGPTRVSDFPLAGPCYTNNSERRTLSTPPYIIMGARNKYTYPYSEFSPTSHVHLLLHLPRHIHDCTLSAVIQRLAMQPTHTQNTANFFPVFELIIAHCLVRCAYNCK